MDRQSVQTNGDAALVAQITSDPQLSSTSVSAESIVSCSPAKHRGKKGSPRPFGWRHHSFQFEDFAQPIPSSGEIIARLPKGKKAVPRRNAQSALRLRYQSECRKEIVVFDLRRFSHSEFFRAGFVRSSLFPLIQGRCCVGALLRLLFPTCRQLVQRVLANRFRASRSAKSQQVGNLLDQAVIHN